MKIEQINKQIEELEAIRSILQAPIQNDSQLIFRTYIDTEHLAKTKKLIDSHNIVQENGNKYQVNDISKFIESDRADVDEATKRLAVKILKQHKTKR